MADPNRRALAPTRDDAAIGALALDHLQRVVAVDSASDERSDAVPSTPGQVTLARLVGAHWQACGAEVSYDAASNVIARFAGRGLGAAQAPIAFMVHLDTARGTHAVDALQVVPRWDGTALAYPNNPGLSVSVATYPSLADFAGHDVVHGPGDAPFGLDDKLGLTHLMTLASLLADGAVIDHPPLVLIGRPDEEVGRMSVVEELATLLAGLGVDFGYTVDGILPYEVNVENFHAAGARVRFPASGWSSAAAPAEATGLALTIGGVNTHGCTAKAEGHRPATRLAAELLDALAPGQAHVVGFISDSLRDCDGVLTLAVPPAERAAVIGAAEAVVGPHKPRGASLAIAEVALDADAWALAACTEAALRFIGRFLTSEGVYPIAAEASEGRQGYSQPYRLLPDGDGVAVDVRLRDFDEQGLTSRVAHVQTQSPEGALVTWQPQYVNMAPRLADRPELVRWPTEAAEAIGGAARELPIRGGTGVDPFLDAGVPVANLGTGYFAPESEKELTSVQHMVGHALWLYALVQRVAHARAALQAGGVSSASTVV